MQLKHKYNGSHFAYPYNNRSIFTIFNVFHNIINPVNRKKNSHSTLTHTAVILGAKKGIPKQTNQLIL